MSNSIEHKILLQVESGASITPEQTQRISPYLRIQEALPLLNADLRAPAGWEARVLANIRPAPTTPRFWVLVPIAAAMLLLFALWPSNPQNSQNKQSLAFEVSLQKGAGVIRSTQAAVGDMMVIQTPGVAIWVYHNESIVLHCPGDALCQSIEGGMRAEMRFAETGSYRVVSSSVAPAQALTGVYDQDLVLLMKAGGRPEWRDIVVW
jgi:hypothetical protein